MQRLFSNRVLYTCDPKSNVPIISLTKEAYEALNKRHQQLSLQTSSTTTNSGTVDINCKKYDHIC